MEKLTEEEKKRIEDIYGMEKSPLHYTIKPRFTVEFREAKEIIKEDFE